MAAVMVGPMDVPLAIQATSASVPIRHVVPSLARLTVPPATGSYHSLTWGFWLARPARDGRANDWSGGRFGPGGGQVADPAAARRGADSAGGLHLAQPGHVTLHPLTAMNDGWVSPVSTSTRRPRMAQTVPSIVSS